MHKYSSGTDGNQTIGRTWHVFLSRSFSLAEMICSCTNARPLNPHMSNATQVQILTGKYPLKGCPLALRLLR